jgi:hypothetical protein
LSEGSPANPAAFDDEPAVAISMLGDDNATMTAVAAMPIPASVMTAAMVIVHADMDTGRTYPESHAFCIRRAGRAQRASTDNSQNHKKPLHRFLPCCYRVANRSRAGPFRNFRSCDAVAKIADVS